MSDITTLRERLTEISKQSDAIRTAAAALERSLNDEERAKIDALSAEFDQVQADILRLEKVDQQREAANQADPASPPQPPASYAPSGAGSIPEVEPAGVKKAETMLIALGVILAVFALLALFNGNILNMVIQGGISLLTFLIGYKALKDGNIGTARTFSLTMGWVYAGLQILVLLFIIAVAEFIGPLFWILWAIGWAFAWGYFYAYQCITPKAQRKMGL